MKNNASHDKLNISKTKGLVVLLVLISLVLTPILTSADTIPPSDNDRYHGSLTIKVGDISLPINTQNITTADIVEKAQPSAIQKGEFGTRTPVAEYFISDDDLSKLNGVTDTKTPVGIVLHGRYLDDCQNPGCQDKIYSITGEAKMIISFTPCSYTVTFHGNGGKIDGKNKYEALVTADEKAGITLGSSKMPQNMDRDDYTFKGWSTSKSSYKPFNKDTLVKENLNVYAYWNAVSKKKDKDVKEIEEIKKEDIPTYTRLSVILNDKPLPEKELTEPIADEPEEVIDTNGKTTYTKAEFLSIAEEQEVPVANIGRGSVPLYAPEGTGGWAFVNLLFAAAGLVMFIVMLIISAMNKRDKKSLWFVLSAIAGIVGPVLFLITENLQDNMVLSDNWTVIHGILFALIITSTIQFFRKSEEVEEYVFKY